MAADRSFPPARGHTRRARRAGHGARSVAWTALVFLLSQALLLAWLWSDVPAWDAEFAQKRQRLRALRTSQPDRPMLLALGSSRTLLGVEAASLDQLTDADGRQFVGFNGGLVAAGPIRQWLALRRVLDDGIRPGLVVVEVAAPFFRAPGSGSTGEEEGLKSARLSAEELWALRPFLERPDRLRTTWLRAHLPPCLKQRRTIVAALLPDWGPTADCDFHYAEMDERGCARYPKPAVTADEFCRAAADCERDYRAALVDFRVARGAVAALAGMLDTCRGWGIPAIVVYAPEHRLFRTWSESARTLLAPEIRVVCATAGVEYIDGNAWVGDDGFWDPHHLLPRGAAAYTDRLAEELAGRGLVVSER